MPGIEGYEVGPATGCITQQPFGKGELSGRQGLLQHRTFSQRVGTPAGKEGHGGGKDQPLQDQAIALPPAAIATRGPRRLHVHVTQPRGKPLLVPVALMPERPVGLVHPPINGRRLGLIQTRLDFGQDLVPRVWTWASASGAIASSRRAIVRRCGTRPNPSACRRVASLVKSVASSWGLKGCSTTPTTVSSWKAKPEKVRGRPRWRWGGGST